MIIPLRHCKCIKCWHRLRAMAGFWAFWFEHSSIHIGQGWALGHCGGSTTLTNREIMSLAGSTPTIEPAMGCWCKDECEIIDDVPDAATVPHTEPDVGMGGGAGALSVINEAETDDIDEGGGNEGTNTSSLPSEQSNKSLTDMAKFRLRRLSLLSWLKYVDTVSTLGLRWDFILFVSVSEVRVRERDRCMLMRLLCLDCSEPSEQRLWWLLMEEVRTLLEWENGCIWLPGWECWLLLTDEDDDDPKIRLWDEDCCCLELLLPKMLRLFKICLRFAVESSPLRLPDLRDVCGCADGVCVCNWCVDDGVGNPFCCRLPLDWVMENIALEVRRCICCCCCCLLSMHFADSFGNVLFRLWP